MLARLRKRYEDEAESGFTLIELLVVMVIIGILAAIAIPTFLNQKNKAYDSAAKSAIRSVATAEESYATNSSSGYATDGGWANLNVSATDKSASTLVKIVDADQAGYCLQAFDARGGAKATMYFWDSQKGGFTTTNPGTCSANPGASAKPFDSTLPTVTVANGVYTAGGWH
jgi:type IV pilus assembly protein PilA